ncbi:MAG: universal stress protein [Syntrophobacter sp.]
MSPDRKLVLLPVDGSEESMQVVKYVSKAVNLSGAEVVLLSVIDKPSDIFWDAGQDDEVSKHIEHMQSWESYKEQKMRECMEDACKILEQAGVPRSGMNCNIQKMKEGIARDILRECKFGYSVVAFGRRGLGQMDESLLGSIAAKVFINVSEAPVCLMGGEARPGKIMVGLDNSLSSIRAVNFVGRMLNPCEQVELLHIVRIPEPAGKPLDKASIDKMVQAQETSMKPIFEDAVKTLTAAGFAPDRIGSRVVQASGSRAVNLYNAAKAGEFGTLVVGRKGSKDVQEFTMGRIAYKLGQVARTVALWVVP